MSGSRVTGWSLWLLYALPASLWAQTEILARDRCVDTAAFQRDWLKYSSIDTRIPLTSRSWPAQQMVAAEAEIERARREIAGLQAKIQIDQEMQAQQKEYEEALTRGLKANLLRAMWRLAWVTYSTTGDPIRQSAATGSGTAWRSWSRAGRAWAKLFTEDVSKVQAVGIFLATAKKVMPKQYSKLPGRSGSVVNVGVDAVLEGMKESNFRGGEGLAAVVKVITKAVETSAKETFPPVDITPEEIEILRSQHLAQQGLRAALEDVAALNRERQTQIDALEIQTAQAETRRLAAVEEERQLTLVKLNRDCRPQSVGQSVGLSASLSGPQRIQLGEVATLSAAARGGSGNYRFHWVADLSHNSPTETTTEGASSRIGFQPTAAGPHQVGVVAVDLNNRSLGTAQAMVLIDVVDPGTPIAANPAPPAPPPPSPIPPPAGGNRMVESLVILPDGPGATTSLLKPMTHYRIEVTGHIDESFYAAVSDEREKRLSNSVIDALWYTTRTYRSKHYPLMARYVSEYGGQVVFTWEDESYSETHTYRATMPFYAAEQIRFYYSGGMTPQPSKTGSWRVTIYEVPRVP